MKRPVRVVKKQRIGPGRHQRMRAQRPDQMWALGEFLNIID
jgi:putative transposase